MRSVRNDDWLLWGVSNPGYVVYTIYASTLTFSAHAHSSTNVAGNNMASPSSQLLFPDNAGSVESVTAPECSHKDPGIIALFILRPLCITKNTFNTDTKALLKKFACDICGKGYSRRDRLSTHLKQEHDIEDDNKKQASRFFCPFKCDLPPFRTMKLLLTHCQSVHEDSLGMHHCKADHRPQTLWISGDSYNTQIHGLSIACSAKLHRRRGHTTTYTGTCPVSMLKIVIALPWKHLLSMLIHSFVHGSCMSSSSESTTYKPLVHYAHNKLASVRSIPIIQLLESTITYYHCLNL